MEKLCPYFKEPCWGEQGCLAWKKKFMTKHEGTVSDPKDTWGVHFTSGYFPYCSALDLVLEK